MYEYHLQMIHVEIRDWEIMLHNIPNGHLDFRKHGHFLF